MASLNSDGVDIRYDCFGDGDAVILCHGFAANRNQAWLANDWHGTLMKAGRKAILFDHRGHGESEKRYDTTDYSIALMARDVLHLMDELGIEKAPIISHSMGARIALELAVNHGARVTAAALIGVGEHMLRPVGDPKVMAAALVTDEPWNIEDEAAASFRAFVESTRGDHRALAACCLGIAQTPDPAALASIDTPIMIVGAQMDELSGDPEPLATAIAGAQLKIIPRCSHHSVLAETMTKDVVFDFLGLPPPEHYEHSW